MNKVADKFEFLFRSKRTSTRFSDFGMCSRRGGWRRRVGIKQSYKNGMYVFFSKV